MYGKSAYDIIEFNYCIGIQIWQYDKLNVCNKNDDETESCYNLRL